MNRRTKMTGQAGLTALCAVALLLSSCGRKGDEKAAGIGEALKGGQEQAVATGAKVDEAAVGDELQESDEDLQAYDYKEFYDDLAPHGSWVRMTAEELGLKLKKQASTPGTDRQSIVEILLGVKNAYAQASVSVEADVFFAWQPSVDLAVEVEAVAPTPPVPVLPMPPEPIYVPYENGDWVYTDAGWYFQAATPAEEITSHYGRWTFTADLGWMWLPGHVWAPAWVDWREDDTYIAWTPIPPQVYITGGILAAPPVFDIERYVIVEHKHFLQPGVYKYMYSVKHNPNKIMIKSMVKMNGIMVKNKGVFNMGPDVKKIEKYTGKSVGMVKINRGGAKGMTKFDGNQLDIHSPKLMKVKGGAKLAGPVSSPKSFLKVSEARLSMKAPKGMGGKEIHGEEGMGGKEMHGMEGKDGKGNGISVGGKVEGKGGPKAGVSGSAGGKEGKAGGGKSPGGGSWGGAPSGGGKAGGGKSSGGGSMSDGSMGGAPSGGKSSGGGKAGGGKSSGGGSWGVAPSGGKAGGGKGSGGGKAGGGKGKK